MPSRIRKLTQKAIEFSQSKYKHRPCRRQQKPKTSDTETEFFGSTLDDVLETICDEEIVDLEKHFAEACNDIDLTCRERLSPEQKFVPKTVKMQPRIRFRLVKKITAYTDVREYYRKKSRRLVLATRVDKPLPPVDLLCRESSDTLSVPWVRFYTVKI